MAQQQSKFNTSFIPKKPAATSTPVGKSGGATFKRKGPNLLSIIGLFIFLASLVATGGVYFWKMQIENQIEDQIENLRQARNEFDEQTVANATRLNERIIAVEDILEKHTAPSNIFAILEDVILKSVRLRNFSYTTQADGQIKVSGSGNAAGYESVVLQSDELGFTGLFRDVVFSNVQTTQDQSVNFNFSALVDSGLFLYSKNMGGELSQTNELETFEGDAENASGLINIFER
jgi:hypothetical protein